jgi:hypothetical protein
MTGAWRSDGVAGRQEARVWVGPVPTTSAQSSSPSTELALVNRWASAFVPVLSLAACTNSDR